MHNSLRVERKRPFNVAIRRPDTAFDSRAAVIAPGKRRSQLPPICATKFLCLPPI